MYQICLPIKINFGAKGEITYLYNATGQKLQKFVKDVVSNTNNTTDYLSGFQYLNTTLQFFPHAEGYVHYTKPLAAQGGENSELGSFNYVFNYTDHLGNVRVSFAKDPLQGNVLKILEENHYYPFGMKHENYNVTRLNFKFYPETGVDLVPLPAVANASYNYKYNGKELQDELGLNVYDLGARNYDPSIGRFFNYDPKAEKYSFQSAYAISINNPVFHVDINGEGVDNEYTFNVSTKSMEYVSDKGGNETDYINWTGEDSDGNTVNIFTEERAVEHTTEYIRTGSEIGHTTYARMAGEFRTIHFLPTPGGLQDPSAEIFASFAGGKILGAVLGNVLGRIFATDAAVATETAATTEMSGVRALGVAGEEAVGVGGSKLRIPSLTGTAKYRIPDRLTSTTLEEVKNVKSLSFTRQLKDFHLYSQQKSLQMILHTRQGTTLSGPLQKLIDNGSIINKTIPKL